MTVTSDKYEAHFAWPHSDASEVIVTGSFDNWSSSTRLNKGANGFEGIASVPWASKVVYKFVVDGRWTVAYEQSTEYDSSGNINNVFTSPFRPAEKVEAVVPVAVGAAPAAAALRPESKDVAGSAAEPAMNAVASAVNAVQALAENVAEHPMVAPVVAVAQRASTDLGAALDKPMAEPEELAAQAKDAAASAQATVTSAAASAQATVTSAAVVAQSKATEVAFVATAKAQEYAAAVGAGMEAAAETIQNTVSAALGPAASAPSVPPSVSDAAEALQTKVAEAVEVLPAKVNGVADILNGATDPEVSKTASKLPSADEAAEKAEEAVEAAKTQAAEAATAAEELSASADEEVPALNGLPAADPPETPALAPEVPVGLMPLAAAVEGGISVPAAAPVAGAATEATPDAASSPSEQPSTHTPVVFSASKPNSPVVEAPNTLESVPEQPSVPVEPSVSEQPSVPVQPSTPPSTNGKAEPPRSLPPATNSNGKPTDLPSGPSTPSRSMKAAFPSNGPDSPGSTKGSRTRFGSVRRTSSMFGKLKGLFQEDKKEETQEEKGSLPSTPEKKSKKRLSLAGHFRDKSGTSS